VTRDDEMRNLATVSAIKPPGEMHVINRIGWLRAAVLGANDGIVSTASIMLGVAAANSDVATILLTGIAALVAGAISMAAGEFVSVSSQADAEQAERAREERELAADPEFELQELAGIYRARGVDADLALTVAEQLMRRDPLEAHMRDELGVVETMAARPVQAALASAASFCAGAIVPVGLVLIVPREYLIAAIISATLVLLAILGATGAAAGGASVARGAARVIVWGALAMGVTTAIGRLFGAVA
jgi:VIT1/CCC1 family predicted Fe2+/Mn2+ transporter